MFTQKYTQNASQNECVNCEFKTLVDRSTTALTSIVWI